MIRKGKIELWYSPKYETLFYTGWAACYACGKIIGEQGAIIKRTPKEKQVTFCLNCSRRLPKDIFMQRLIFLTDIPPGDSIPIMRDTIELTNMKNNAGEIISVFDAAEQKNDNEVIIDNAIQSHNPGFMIMQDAAEKNLIEFMGGPSIEVGWQATTTGLSVFKNLVGAFSGAEVTNPTKDDLLRFARMFSSANQAYNAYTAFKYGEVLTRDNSFLDRIEDPSEAIFAAFGVPLERQEEAWKFNTFKGYDKFFDKKTAEGIQRAMNSYAEAFRRGDFTEAENYAKIIAMKYSSMSPAEQQRVKRLVFPPKGSPITDDLMLQALRNESGFAE